MHFFLSQIASYGPQISSASPLDTNIYGLGEVVASSGFRRDVRGTIQTLWNRDAGDPIDENMQVSISSRRWGWTRTRCQYQLSSLRYPQRYF